MEAGGEGGEGKREREKEEERVQAPAAFESIGTNYTKSQERKDPNLCLLQSSRETSSCSVWSNGP